MTGLILGTALGDSLGLPMEGLSPIRQKLLFPGRLRQRLIAGRGMVSDDTDHAFFVGQCLLAFPDDAQGFERRLAWCLRGWIAALPVGIGFATLRSLLLLWLCVPPSHSGVRSAGNGPAMRSPILGARFSEDPERLERYLKLSTRMTHTDPKAQIGAIAVARMASAIASQVAAEPPDSSWLIDILSMPEADAGWQEITDKVTSAAERRAAVSELAILLGLEKGVTGFIYHTTPVALYAVWRHWGDFESTVESVINAGGDTDTVAAIAGALAGFCVGEQALPQEWLRRLWDPFRGLEAFRELGKRLSERDVDRDPNGRPQGPISWPYWLLPLRHLIQLPIILAHGFRRLAPPYSFQGAKK